MPGPIVLSETTTGWTAHCRHHACTVELAGSSYEHAKKLANEHMHSAHPETTPREHNAWVASSMTSKLFAVACDFCGYRSTYTLTQPEAKALARDHDQRGNAALVAS